MYRTVVVTTLVLITVAMAFAGDPPKSGKPDPGALARQYYLKTLAGGPVAGPSGTEAISQRIFNGAAAGDNLGYTVASAGDVNGDGYGDVIMGSPLNDAGGSNAGRAYIYFGGKAMNTTPDVLLTGAASGDEFGWSVAGAGDVNGDGYDDVIVGAPFNDEAGSNAGRAYIFYGGMVIDGTVNVTLTGAAAGDCFGCSVAGAGDVNGDGYCDVLVGAYLHDAGETDAGGAYIYLGDSRMNVVADVTLTGAAAYDYFGWSVAGAGDVNGDGYGDVIVGAMYNDFGGTNAGRAYVYLGSSTMEGTADVTLTGSAAGDNFGWCVARAGDVNGDGYSDVIVGGPLNDSGGTDAGRAYVYYGGEKMNALVDVRLTGVAAGDCLGWSVAGAGDVNGDGYGDMIVGAHLNDAGGTDAGRAYIYFGSAQVDAVADVQLTGEAVGDNFGFSVASAGDVNGDGWGDVIVGGPYENAEGNDAGRAYLYANSLTGTDIPDERFIGEADYDAFGYSVAGAGDVNGDGYDDVIVGAFHNGAAGTDAGRATIYFGGPAMDATADVTLTGEAAGDYFGISVAGAGDVNGDGYSDVIVGAPYNITVGPNRGAAYIYFGGPAMDATADVTLSGADDGFGESVAGAGDVNGDGYSDVIVGSPFNDANGTEAGAARIYYGGLVMNSSVDVMLKGEAAGDWFGGRVAPAGDVNGDGYGDVIVGAVNNDSGGADAGRAYIYYGNTSMSASADVILTGSAPSNLLGCSVASAGDVNGDGFSDVIVGGNAFARVYFGGTLMDAVEDVSLRGTGGNDFYGSCVAGAGDLNADGYDDVIVGAFYSEGFDPGRVYLYFGGADVDTTANIMITGQAVGDRFGQSVAAAGDMNGDGCSDLIVGATYWSLNAPDHIGRAYICLSSAPPIVPRISAVADVPFDQGGQVTVRWVRSGYDSPKVNKISTYQVERSRPPGVSGFAWEPVATVLPRQRAMYEYTVSTPNDSMENNSGTYYFQVTAQTSNPDEFWRSNIVSAHSVDNLAPAAIGNLGATPITTASIRLNWPANTRDADLGAYVLYRSVTNGFVPGESNRLVAVTDTLYLDSSLPAAPIVYYRVRARDIHGNLGGLSPQAAVALASTQSYAVTTSWNMISVPVQVDDFRKVVLYPTATSAAFAYAGGYVTKDTLQNGIGYWLKFPSAQPVPMTGFALIGDTIPVVSGWNMVGSIGAEVPVSQVTSNPSGLIVSPFYTYASGYVASDTVKPHKGYWVKVQQAGELILTLSGPMGGAVQIVEPNDQPPEPPTLVGVANEELPTVFALLQNFPNPFNPTTEIRFDVALAGDVRLVVYDLLGREVAILVNERKAPGRYTVTFDAGGLASGMYAYRLTAGDFVQTRKLLLLR